MLWSTLVILIGLIFVGWCMLCPKNNQPQEGYQAQEGYESLASNTLNLKVSPHVPDVRYWPWYHYTLPYRYGQAGAWPPGMHSRFLQWQPGHDLHTWSVGMRPGMGFTRWPRNRWVRNNGSYYHIDNGTIRDRMYDYYGRA